MKQSLISYDKTANTFDIFAGAKGKGKPLECYFLGDFEFSPFLNSVIKDQIDEGYKVNLSTELEGLIGRHVATIVRSKEDLMDNFLGEKPKPKQRQWRFKAKETEVKTELPIHLL